MEEGHFEVVGVEEPCFIGVVGIEGFFDGRDVLFVELGSDV